VRIAGTILSSVGLLWGFVQAPFLHIHPEVGEHPITTIVHLHAPELRSSFGPTIHAPSPDDDVTYVDWCIASPRTVEFTVDLTIAAVAVTRPPAVVSAVSPIPRIRGHAPPDLTPTQPRSPPA
jgi:hypothetical protein